MHREEISKIAHTEHPIKAPLDDDSVRRLLDRGLPRGDERVLDLGCGGGEWLLRALTTRPRVHAEGVDISEEALAQAGLAARDLGVEQRLTLHQTQAADFTPAHPFDLVLSVGATHAFGGLLPTLAAAREHLAPGGRVVIGEGFWEHPPSPEAAEMLGDYSDLATTVDRVVADGWTPSTGTSARAANWTTTNGPAGGHWHRGPWTALPIRTARTCSRRPPPAAPNGSTPTGTPSASSPWSCDGPPTSRECPAALPAPPPGVG